MAGQPEKPNPRRGKVKVTRFGDSWQNLLRITTVRIIVQAVVLGLFLSFVLLTTFAHLNRFPALRLWVSKILEVDPLVAQIGRASCRERV